MTDTANLPKTIDVADFLYDFDSERHIKLNFRSRNDFFNDFKVTPGPYPSDTEYILRKYMYAGYQTPLSKAPFAPGDKQKLIKILKIRLQYLQNSKEFTSSILKNEIFRQSYMKLQTIIDDLENSEKLENDEKMMKKCKDGTIIENMNEEKIFRLVLELSWMLLHPDKIPKKKECEWATLIKNLDELNITKLILMNSKSTKKVKAVNHFKEVNHFTNVKQPFDDKLDKYAEEDAKDPITPITPPNHADITKNRIQILLNLLEVNKHLHKQERDAARAKTIIGKTKSLFTAAKDTFKSTFKSTKGGSARNPPITKAMMPLFDYFKELYDPIYSFLEKSINSYKKKTKRSVLLLLRLLHICNNIPKSPDKHGVYRIINIDNSVLFFINHMINATNKKLKKKTTAYKDTFNKQIYKLPKVRLSTLLHSRKNDDILPHFKFLRLDKNLHLDSDKYTFFNKKDLYIVYNEFNNYEDTPMNQYEIDFKTIDSSDTHIPIKKLDSNPDLLDNISTITSTFNDAELALSIFIRLKEILPT